MRLAAVCLVCQRWIRSLLQDSSASDKRTIQRQSGPSRISRGVPYVHDGSAGTCAIRAAQRPARPIIAHDLIAFDGSQKFHSEKPHSLDRQPNGNASDNEPDATAKRLTAACKQPNATQHEP